MNGKFIIDMIHRHGSWLIPGNVEDDVFEIKHAKGVFAYQNPLLISWAALLQVGCLYLNWSPTLMTAI